MKKKLYKVKKKKSYQEGGENREPQFAMIEAEGKDKSKKIGGDVGETILNLDGNLHDIVGPSHKKGGVDILAKTGAYVFSDNYYLKKGKEREEDYTGFKEGGGSMGTYYPLPKHFFPNTLSNLMSEDKLTPAEVSMKIRKQFKLKKDPEDLHGFRLKTYNANKQSAIPYYQELIQLSEDKKKKKTPKLKHGGYTDNLFTNNQQVKNKYVNFNNYPKAQNGLEVNPLITQVDERLNYLNIPPMNSLGFEQNDYNYTTPNEMSNDYTNQTVNSKNGLKYLPLIAQGMNSLYNISELDKQRKLGLNSLNDKMRYHNNYINSQNALRPELYSETKRIQRNQENINYGRLNSAYNRVNNLNPNSIATQASSLKSMVNTPEIANNNLNQLLNAQTMDYNNLSNINKENYAGIQQYQTDKYNFQNNYMTQRNKAINPLMQEGFNFTNNLYQQQLMENMLAQHLAKQKEANKYQEQQSLLQHARNKELLDMYYSKLS